MKKTKNPSRVASTVALVLTTTTLSGCDAKPLATEPPVPSALAVASVRSADAEPLTGVLDDLTQRILPVLPAGAATNELRASLEAIRTSAAQATGSMPPAVLERAINALNGLATTPDAALAAPDLEVARLALEHAVALLDVPERARLRTQLHESAPFRFQELVIRN